LTWVGNYGRLFHYSKERFGERGDIARRFERKTGTGRFELLDEKEFFVIKKRIIVFLGLLGMVALLLACAGGGEATPTGGTPGTQVAAGVVPTVTVSAQRPEYGGTWRYAYLEPDAGWDFHKTISYKTEYMQSFVQANLVQYPVGPGADPYDFSVAPYLAESWKMSDDGRSVTFYLQKGVKWQNRPPTNGREFVADDVKFSFDHMKRVKSQYWEQFTPLESVEVIDKYTVKFNLQTPYAPLFNYLGGGWGFIYAREVEEQYGDMMKPENVVGLGPFMIKESQPSVGTRFVRNPDYFEKDKYGNQLPYIDELWAPHVADTSTALAAFRAGQLDHIAIGITDLESVKKSNPEVGWYPQFVGFGSSFLWYNLSKPPFDDVRVRQAISMALDRQMWVDSFYLGQGVTDNGPVPAAMAYWKLPLDKLGECAKYQQYNPTEAKKLLAEAGYPNGFETTLHYTTAYGVASGEQAELWADILANIGIKAKVKTWEYGAFLGAVYVGNFDGIAYIPVTAFQEVDMFMYYLYHSSSTRYGMNRTDGGDNLDQLIMAQRGEINPEKRREIIYEIQRILDCRCYRVVVPAGYTRMAYHPWCHDYNTKAGAYNYGPRFARYWLDKTSPTRRK
jgi:peptide/nickel transport system substrate-binding protein